MSASHAPWPHAGLCLNITFWREAFADHPFKISTGSLPDCSLSPILLYCYHQRTHFYPQPAYLFIVFPLLSAYRLREDDACFQKGFGYTDSQQISIEWKNKYNYRHNHFTDQEREGLQKLASVPQVVWKTSNEPICVSDPQVFTVLPYSIWPNPKPSLEVWMC